MVLPPWPRDSLTVNLDIYSYLIPYHLTTMLLNSRDRSEIVHIF